MKRLILFEEGFCNFIKMNLPFYGTDSDIWVCVVDRKTLDEFTRANQLNINKQGHILVRGEIWGVIQ